MRINRILAMSTLAAVVAACESGDVNLSPTNIDNSTGGGGSGGGSGSNPCASYTTAGGALRQGTLDGGNCRYSSSFSSTASPVTADLDIPSISGVHIFEDVLAIGQDVSAGAAPAGGAGPVLTIAAGTVLAFSDQSDYLVINRGSQIIADGRADAPITFTSVTDAVLGTVGPEDVQQWGGIVMNGNGITNNCTDMQRDSNDCHVVSEGQPVHYGGNDNGESSGVLRYVVVKHTGSEVAPDDELNGITFNAVGAGTIVSHLQVYSTYDDGIEFFGGAVDIEHFVALYVKDDSIDFSDGYVGTIDTALIVQSQLDGNRCVEGDNIGDTRASNGVPLDTAPMTSPSILNMTCIIGNGDMNTHDPSEGPTLRRGPQMTLVDSVVYGAYADDLGEDNECFELDEDGVTNAWAQAGTTNVRHSLLVCEFATQSAEALPNGDSLEEWFLGANPSSNGADYSFNVGNAIVQTDDLSANANLQILDSFYTRPDLIDEAGNPLVLTPESGRLGAVTRDDDWTADWTYGLHPEQQGQALWIGNP